MIIKMSLFCILKLKFWAVWMLDYHHMEFRTKNITIMKIYYRKNMTPLPVSLKIKAILSRKRTKEHNYYNRSSKLYIKIEKNSHILTNLLKLHSTRNIK